MKMFRITSALNIINKGISNNILLSKFCQKAASNVTEEEIKTILLERFPNARTVDVTDASGGCGAMFNILIESSEFKGLSVLKQHKAVYDSLQKQIKKIHGLHIETKPV